MKEIEGRSFYSCRLFCLRQLALTQIRQKQVKIVWSPRGKDR